MKIGFASPEAGGSHSYMRCGAYTFTVPGNKEYSVPQVKALLKEIERGINRKIELDEWENL
jgi:hypothetical protein